MKFNKIILPILLFAAVATSAQFRTKDRMENLENFDLQKFSWGFFLAANNFDYKLVLDPKYGMSQSKTRNQVEVKHTYSFGAGLIGKMRLNASFDLRIEPGMQFVQRDITFDTQENNVYAPGNKTNAPFTPIVMKDADKYRRVKSTYIDIPVLLEYHGDRWYNSRPYILSGFNYMVNLQSNQSTTDDNSNGIFRSTTHNFGWTAEIGIQFYFHRFKLTPGFRGTFVMNNELVRDNPSTPPYWATAISTVQTRAFMFVLKFE